MVTREWGSRRKVTREWGSRRKVTRDSSRAQRERQTDQVHITAFPHGILGVGPTLPRLQSQLDVAFPAV